MDKLRGMVSNGRLENSGFTFAVQDAVGIVFRRVSDGYEVIKCILEFYKVCQHVTMPCTLSR